MKDYTAIPSRIRDLAIQHQITVRMTRTVQGCYFEVLDLAGRPGRYAVTVASAMQRVRAEIRDRRTL